MHDEDGGGGDVQRGLKLSHEMALSARADGLDLAKEVYTLLEVLVQRGVIRLSDLRERYPVVSDRLDTQWAKKTPSVQIGQHDDKYHLMDLPDIDCASLIPICKAKCCTLQFPLSEQDLDEGIVRWDYRKPYRIRQAKSGYCGHCEPTTKACGVYQHRPAPCRMFDCREDRRIWLDFEKKIPAPDDVPEE